MSKMKILIIADEVWSDTIHGNNVLSNWFSGFEAEFAEIYCSPGTPKNNCCENYFQITDSMMAKSFFGKKAGRAFHITVPAMQNESVINNAEQIPTSFYRFMKSITGEGLRIVRDLIWLYGIYDKKGLQKFIDDFQPDIVFCPRLLTPKLLRLERIVANMTNTPFVAFTADDEVSLMQVSYSPLYWIRRLLFRSAFKKHVRLYKHYFMFSEEQAKDYYRNYKILTSTLFKSGNFESQPAVKLVNNPLKLVYAGRLYCNRWKTLAAIGDALKTMNANGTKITLDIYTQEDAQFLVRSQALESDRILGVETGGCPHTAIREDASINLVAIEELEHKFTDLDLVFVESGGDNLAATFSPELVDLTIYVIDVAAGDKIPRKGGPGITKSDLLVINKIDLAPFVGADLGVMERDAKKMRGEKPFVFTNLKTKEGLASVVDFVKLNVA